MPAGEDRQYGALRQCPQAYLCHNHKKRLEQQGKLEAIAKPEETSGDVRQQPNAQSSVKGFKNMTEFPHRIAQTSREKPVASLVARQQG